MKSQGKDTTYSDPSLFVHSWGYRAVLAIRNACADACLTAGFLALALWWEAVFNHARPSYLQLAASSGWLRWWVEHGLVPVPPAATAGVLFAVGLHIGGRRSRSDLTSPERIKKATLGETLWPDGEPSLGRLARLAALYGAAVLLAASVLGKCPGGVLACYVPALAALLIASRFRRWRSRRRVHQLRRPTQAGFRPSRRAMLPLRGWVALENVDTAYPQVSLVTTNIADTVMDESAARFRRRGDYRSVAYCLARGIEYLLTRNKIADAGARSRAAIEDERLGRQPAIMAVRAQFLTVVGQHAEALQLLLGARGATRRPPAQLEALILGAAIDSGRYSGTRQWRWSGRRRAAMIWRGQPSAVLLGLAADVRLLEHAHPGAALELAYRICRLPGCLTAQLKPNDFGVADHQRARLAKGIALDVAARIYQRRGQHLDACTAYMDAYGEFESIKDRARAGPALVRGLSSALAAGHAEPGQESHALDLIRVGLQVVEDDRGTLRGEDSRASWIASQRQLYATVFSGLSSVKYMGAKAGELGLWLLESLHRTMTASLMRNEGALESDPELLAALAELARREYDTRLAWRQGKEAQPATPQDQEHLAAVRKQVRARFSAVREASLVAEPTDVEAALSRLGDRVALLYHCWREDTGWVIHSVLVSPRHAIRVRTTNLEAPPDSEVISPLLTPAGALDALEAGDPASITFLFSTPLDEQMWEDLAQAILPPAWWDVLCPSSGSPIDLLIVPDGPIASLPLAALPVRNGKLLIEYACVALTPALSLLQGREWRRLAPEGQPVAIVHLDHDASLPATAHEAEHWRLAAQRMQVIETADQAGIESALHGPPQPDVVMISVHGTTGKDDGSPDAQVFGTAVRLRDSSVLSAVAALRLRWPSTVILGACWVSAVSIRAGREPFGFPLACLIRGAPQCRRDGTHPGRRDSDILGQVIDSLPDRGPILNDLREAQMRH